VKARDLDRRITFLRKIPATGVLGAGKEVWEPLPPVWAQVIDVLPSRGDELTDGFELTSRPALIRIRHPEFELTTDMRIQYGSRLMSIITAPAELSSRDGVQFKAEDYTTTGNPA
jgi:head-tail adaptor